MLKKFLKLLNDLKLFTASYSNNIFPDPLTKDEEEKCIDNMLKGDNLARNKLIEHNLRLVAHIVKKYDSREDSDDLISIGTIGLIKGIDSFSNKHGVKLTTYCARCIENEILMFFRSNNKNLKNVSLNEKVGYDKDGNEIMILDVLKAPTPDYVDEIAKKDNIKLLSGYLSILTPREKEIIERRYGLNGNKEQTQKVIAKELKISRSYVSRIEKRSLTKILREFIKNKKSD